MRYKKLINCVESDLPEWIKKADIEDAVIRFENGYLIWKDGIWKDGIWKYGIWKDGIWKDGIWKDGIWKGGIWERGIWKGGIWERGIWKGGIWERGIWERGIWEGGIWKGGWSSPRCRWTVRSSSDGRVAIGCEERSIEDWDVFFEGDEELATPRDSEQFRMIRAHYEAVKAYCVALGFDKKGTKGHE